MGTIQTTAAARGESSASLPVWTFLPAHDRDGAVKAWAFIDSADYRWASEKCWYVTEENRFRRNLSHETEGRGYISLHREILGLEKGDPVEVDHINRNPLDNRRCNLRLADSSGNKQNIGLKSNNKTGYRGVSYDKKRRKWVAQIKLTAQGLHLRKRCDSKEEAAELAAAWRAEHMPYATD